MADQDLTRAQLEARLEIDNDDLTESVKEQSTLFYHVAKAYAYATGRRDKAKRELEKITAELDRALREDAARSDEKITEVSLGRALQRLPRIRDAEDEVVELKAKADAWQALKESYQQRSFMLRAMVDLRVSEIGDLSIEHGSRSLYRRVREQESDAATQARERAYQKRAEANDDADGSTVRRGARR